ncbi:MAG: hypothetical protein M2R45_03354 [Verrucomicrobia subdivision 3 bacterium]|nr:hypothetical protein [Limisphaerales bacterium]
MMFTLVSGLSSGDLYIYTDDRDRRKRRRQDCDEPTSQTAGRNADCQSLVDHGAVERCEAGCIADNTEPLTIGGESLGGDPAFGHAKTTTKRHSVATLQDATAQPFALRFLRRL